jgi:hypothetical protein
MDKILNSLITENSVINVASIQPFLKNAPKHTIINYLKMKGYKVADNLNISRNG